MLFQKTKEYDVVDSGAASANFDWRACVHCGDDVRVERWNLGFKLCMTCGEDSALAERASWCVVQPYGKGPYMLVTVESAPQTLLDTNQKNPRSN
jgi:ribosomal protein S27AE